MTGTESELRKRIAELRAEVAVLTAENQLLRKKLGPSAWRIDGRRAEEFVQQLIGGTLRKGSASSDLILPNGTHFEIKYSRLNVARPDAKTRRWNWAHILGSSGNKQFHKLLLLAPHDPQYRHSFDDPDSPFVIFDVPFKEVPNLVEASGTIWINTNPTKFKRHSHRELIVKYQITRKKFVERYNPR